MLNEEEEIVQTPPLSRRIREEQELDDDEESDSFEEQEFRDAQSRLFFLFPDLEETVGRSTSASSQQESAPRPTGSTMERQTGVLWKRRDVFKNRWRPRWFALNPGQGVLTYFLLTSPAGEEGSSMADAITPPRGSSAERNRTSSWDSGISAVSENSVDYDVVPRGTIYLLGCTVMINDALSKPSGNLYAFSIRPPVRSEPSIHLAARTAELRGVWVDRIDRVCRVGSPREMINLDSQTPPRQPTLVSATPLVERLGDPYSVTRTATPGLRRRLEDSIAEEGDSPLRSNGSGTSSINNDESDAWRVLGSPQSLYTDVPDSLRTRIQGTLETYLRQCDENDASVWKEILMNDETDHRAYQRLDAQGRAIIKSVAVLNHPVKQVFGLLVDITRRNEYEPKLRANEQMNAINPYTFLDYYAYNAVWPTQAREFTVATHWTIVGKGDDRAIAVVSFSCPEADALRPTKPNFVRADLRVSMYLLRPMTSTLQQQQSKEQCHFTRLLSFDLGGTVSRHMSNIVSSQQAQLPSVIAQYLRRNEPAAESRYLGILTNETVESTVIKYLKRGSSTTGNLAPPISRPPSPQSTDASSDQTDTAVKTVAEAVGPPALELQAIMLLAPVFVYGLMLRYRFQGAAFVFAITSFLAVRLVVMLHLGDALPCSDDQMLLGPVTCRFAVELKGVIRYVKNKNEERAEWKNGRTEITVVHIVATALARALVKEPALRSRRAVLPWLLINRVVDTRYEPVDVSISENGGGLITLKGVESLTIQDVANGHASADSQTNTTRTVGQCLVLSSSNSGEAEMVTDAAPVHHNVSVVAILGEAYLEHVPTRARSSDQKRPCMSMSLTITRQYQADIVTCRRFAGEVRKFLAYPEMCDVDEIE